MKLNLKNFLIILCSSVAFGLGINGIFSNNSDARIQFLENPIISYALLIAGGVISFVCLFKAYEKVLYRLIHRIRRKSEFRKFIRS